MPFSRRFSLGHGERAGARIARARDAAEASERQAVATEIDGLVRESGLSQAQFASQIGTSASRLSTYVNGKVTPSAALLVRMRCVTGAGQLTDGHEPDWEEHLKAG